MSSIEMDDRWRSGGRSGLVERIRASTPALAWIEVLDGASLAHAVHAGDLPHVRAALVNATILDGAKFAAVRGREVSTIGVALSGYGSIWCKATSEAAYAAVVWAIGSIPGDAGDQRGFARDGAAWSRPGVDAIAELIDRVPDVLGALVLRDGFAMPVRSWGSGVLELRHSVELAARRRVGLAVSGGGGNAIVTAESRVWCFGAELDPSTGETLWLFLDRRSAQGLGWAILEMLAKELRTHW